MRKVASNFGKHTKLCLAVNDGLVGFRCFCEPGPYELAFAREGARLAAASIRKQGKAIEAEVNSLQSNRGMGIRMRLQWFDVADHIEEQIKKGKIP